MRHRRVIVALRRLPEWKVEERDRLLSIIRSVAGEGARVNDVRVGNKRLEIDAFVHGELDEFLRELNAIAPVEYVNELKGNNRERKDSLLNEFRKLFNDERFWEAHEALEDLWLNKSGKERDLLGGLILVAAAYVHYQRNRPERFYSVLARALSKLERCGVKVYEGINIVTLREEVRSLLRQRSFRIIKMT